MDIPIATAVPMDDHSKVLPSAPTDDAPSFLQGVQNEGGACEFLSQYKWPTALQTSFLNNLKRTPVRFFVCDDSGSMAAHDGHRIVDNNGKFQMVTCSRWTELGESMRFHIGLARAGCIPTEFRMLNSSAPVRIGFSPDESPDSANSLVDLFTHSPGGGTPLCRHIREITAEITAYAPYLRSRGQRACVIIATDGESSDGDIAQALRPLKDLPCWLVVRLCTNEDRIVDYWNGIDSELELEIDVIDDLSGEAKEIHKVNPWLTYCDSFHRLREFGVSFKEFDMLDESKLSLEQARKICTMIYGETAINKLPLPEIDLSAFCRGLDELNQRQDNNVHPVWSPVKHKLLPWVDSSRFKGLYGRTSASCTIN